LQGEKLLAPACNNIYASTGHWGSRPFDTRFSDFLWLCIRQGPLKWAGTLAPSGNKHTGRTCVHTKSEIRNLDPSVVVVEEIRLNVCGKITKCQKHSQNTAIFISYERVDYIATTCFGLYRPSSGCTTSCYKVKLHNMQGACYWWRDLVHMIYSNLNRVECCGTDITCISDDVLSEAGIINSQLGNSTRTWKLCSCNCLPHLIVGDQPPQISSHKFTTTAQSTTTLLCKQHVMQHFQLIHHCWAPSGTESIAPSTHHSP
jgi:hypothetical protein